MPFHFNDCVGSSKKCVSWFTQHLLPSTGGRLDRWLRRQHIGGVAGCVNRTPACYGMPEKAVRQVDQARLDLFE